MTRPTAGIHHVTAIAADPQVNIDFFTGVLGLRLVKRTVNFDDPGSYHFYYGDETGTPGTIMTFFANPATAAGSRGSGQATTTLFTVPAESLGFWHERLAAAGAKQDPVMERFGDPTLVFRDPVGLRVGLVGVAEPDGEPWARGPVPFEHALRGVHSVELSVRRPDKTGRLLRDVLGYEMVGDDRNSIRLAAADVGQPGRFVDIRASDEPRGTIASGTVHHVAFRAADDDAEEAIREAVSSAGLRVTDVKERNYFRSIYFREPSGVLFEIATDAPGFPVDEPVATLGRELKLPGWLESQRDEIEAGLPPVDVPG